MGMEVFVSKLAFPDQILEESLGKSTLDNCLRLPLFLSPGLVVTFCHTFVFHCENLH